MSGKKRMIKSVVTGLLCGMLVSVVLMCLAALAMTKTGLLPVWIVEYLTAGCLAAGAFAGGFIAAKLNHGAALTIGAITGAAMITALLLTAALRGEAEFSPLFFIKLGAAVAGGSLGGILSVHERKRI